MIITMYAIGEDGDPFIQDFSDACATAAYRHECVVEYEFEFSDSHIVADYREAKNK